MGGQTSKGSFGMKERSAPARPGESVVKYRLHGGAGKQGKRRTSWSSLLFFLGVPGKY